MFEIPLARTILSLKILPKNTQISNLSKHDFVMLLSKACSLRRKADGSWSLDFANPESSRVLAKAVFKTEYDLEVELPKGHLIPTIPNRMDYILWIEDLLECAKLGEEKIYGIDIGTGPSCVYPLVSASIHSEWNFVATDVDKESCTVAERNVKQNNSSDRIKIVHNPDGRKIISPALDFDQEHTFAFVMTNPPFYDGQADLDECRKLKSNAPPEIVEYTDSEYFFEGGEFAFIKIMFEESLRYKDRVIWYTSIVAKKSNLKPLKQLIKSHSDVKTYHWERFIQGTTSRWAIAWSFRHISLESLKSVEGTKIAEKNIVINLVSSDIQGETLLEKVTDELKSLGIESISATSTSVQFIVKKDTWCRRSRRGHPPSDAVFDCTLCVDKQKVVFTLPSQHRSQEQSFISLVSHITRKWSLTKK